MKQREIVFYHGETIWSEYPEHLGWYIPDLCKNINKLLVPNGINIEKPNVDPDESLIDLIITGLDTKKILELNLEIHKDFEQLNKYILNELNDLIQHKIKGYHIVGYRPSNNSNLTLVLANKVELATIVESHTPINKIKTAQLHEATAILSDVKTIADFQLQHKTENYPGDFYLPIHNQSDTTELTELLDKIAKLNPNNQIEITVKDFTSSEQANIVLQSDGKRQEAVLKVRDFDKMGLVLNKSIPSGKSKYILIQPNEDDLIYAFINETTYDDLKANELVREPYSFNTESDDNKNLNPDRNTDGTPNKNGFFRGLFKK